MFGAILKVTNSSFQKGITFCRSVYVKKVMRLLAFIFEQPSYVQTVKLHFIWIYTFYNLQGLKNIITRKFRPVTP